METKPNDLVNPVIKKHYIGDGDYEESVNGGLSKREYFAAMVIQGMMASSVGGAFREVDYQYFSQHAVKFADALIKALNAKETLENEPDLQDQKS